MEAKQTTKTLRPTPSLSNNAPVRGRPYRDRANGSESHRPLPGVTCFFYGDLAGLPNACGEPLWVLRAWEIPMPREQVNEGRKPDPKSEFTLRWTSSDEAILQQPPTVEFHAKVVCRADLVTIAEAARRMRMRTKDAKEWLDENNLICDLAGRPRIVWGEVLDLVQQQRDEGMKAQRKRPREESNSTRRLPLSDLF